MKLSIVTPIYNNFNFTKQMLEDISCLDVEMILVDNGSSDSFTESGAFKFNHLKKPNNFKYLPQKENLGFAKGSNIGYSVSSGDYVLFMNNDIRVLKDRETWIFDFAKSAGDGIVAAGAGLLDSDFNFVKECKTLESGNSYLGGWALMAKREIWEKLKIGDGPFDADTFFCYFEDTDLSFRARKLNIPLKVTPVPLFHFGRVTGNLFNLPEMYAESRKKFLKKWK